MKRTKKVALMALVISAIGLFGADGKDIGRHMDALNPEGTKK